MLQIRMFVPTGGDMSKSGARFDSNQEVTWLEKKHATLKERVAHLDSLRHLTPTQSVERQRLKKEKLRTKDVLQNFRNQMLS